MMMEYWESDWNRKSSLRFRKVNLELETFRGISIELYKAQNFYLCDFSNSEWFMKTTVLLYYATLNAPL